MACTCASPSSWVTPSSTSSPSPMLPTTSPSTVTEAEVTRWTTARMRPCLLLRVRGDPLHGERCREPESREGLVRHLRSAVDRAVLRRASLRNAHQEGRVTCALQVDAPLDPVQVLAVRPDPAAPVEVVDDASAGRA